MTPRPEPSVSTYELPTKEIADADAPSIVPSGRPRSEANKAAEEPETELSQGDFVGRYSVLSCLGRGGMGVVYKAYDPQLDRNVALKLLRRGRGSVHADLRLLREAQTLAKLKHPNVVAVYDAGLTHHGVFIAMELLAGKSLNEWLEATPRTVGEIIEVFRAAGRGLIAAHDAGFVHRDFKPSNVLVEDDGSVRVLDFGLAHSVQDARSDDDLAALGDSDPFERDLGQYPSGSRDVFATQAGTLVGTPAFMAPEQLLGGRGDHRSEQFAFAMSLYVALYDRSPLGGETYEERRATMEQGLRVPEQHLERSANGERVPPRIRQVIQRGLADDPKDRFASMAELLEQLEQPPSRWRLIAIAGFTLLAGFGVGAMVFEKPEEQPCADPSSALEGTWGPADRARVEETFLGHGELVSSAFVQVRDQLDRYATDWVDMYGESCKATFISHQQSELLFDRRMRCLRRRRNRLRQAIDSLVSAETPAVLTQRTIVPFKLPSLDGCADLEQLTVEQSLPDDEELRRRIEQLRERIDEADTLYDAGEFKQGLELAATAAAEARELGYPLALDEALWSLGRLQLAGGSAREAQTTLEEAVLMASEAGDDRNAAAAWTGLVFSLAIQRRFDGAAATELAARAAVARSGDEEMRGWLLNSLGVLYTQQGDAKQGQQYMREALEAKAKALGSDHVDVAISWYNLGSSVVDEDPDAAREAFEHARRIFLVTVGERHPMTLYVTTGLCKVERIRGHAEAAVELCSGALAHFEAYPTSSWWMGQVSFALAEAQWDVGMHEAARENAEKARVHLLTDDPTTAQRIGEWIEDPEGTAGRKQDREVTADAEVGKDEESTEPEALEARDRP
ncbi:serine/threonine-protein kinase [Paraliomyxa miuraensis]|uniref:serine/threonine-protein kinase n=1 Tax=Paraliomyxa miuraensis TaxID=376150 RepID=UPI002257F1ED|nr:serine/threonine-protein kinase [Paraliomyxa miuraensis]MCX4242121.1 serine/threonine-protein kinase [Paraliomyxa miuraensis]